MENKSGIKDCPRCGLRNRLSSTTCDFCGYLFERSSNGLEDSLDSLVKISRETAVAEERDVVSQKILSTLRRPDDSMIKADAETVTEEPGPSMTEDLDDEVIARTIRAPVAVAATVAPETAGTSEIVDDVQGTKDPMEARETAAVEVGDRGEAPPEIGTEPSKVHDADPDMGIGEVASSEIVTEQPLGTMVREPLDIDDDAIEDTHVQPAEANATRMVIAEEVVAASEGPDDAEECMGIVVSPEPLRGRGSQIRTWLPLASGLVIYAASIGASMAGIGNQITSWGGVALGSIAIASGLFGLSGQWFLGQALASNMVLIDGGDDIEYVCPVCQEIVSMEADTCPGCSSPLEVE